MTRSIRKSLFEGEENSKELTRHMRRRMDCNRVARQLIYYLNEHFGRFEIKRGIEVGVERGRTTIALLTAFPHLEIHAIDSWREVPGYAADQYQHDDNLMQTLFRIQRARDRCVLHVCDLEEGAQRLYSYPPQFDFAYLDADHHQDPTTKALNLYWPHVRSGGIICGDDYNSKAEQAGVWGVKVAVDAWAEDKGKLNVEGRFWWMVKEPST